MTRRIPFALAVPLALVVAACSSGSARPAPIPPTSQPPASLPADDTGAPDTTATATTTTTTTAAPTTSTVVPGGAAVLSPDGPWKLVDSAPGVTSPGLVYELMPKLWVFLPTEESADDGNLFVPAPEDIPIIEAYLQARLVYFRAITSDPIDLADPGWAQFYADGGQSYFDVLVPRREQGQVADLDAGVVLRPRVLGEGRTATEAIIFDCMLDGAVWKLPTGSLGPGSTPGVVENGLSSQLTINGQGWIASTVSTQSEACT